MPTLLAMAQDDPTNEPTPSRAADRASSFPESDWLYCPVLGGGFPRDALRACGDCGGLRFVLVIRGDGSDCHCYCGTCYARPLGRLARPGDIPYGDIDISDGPDRARIAYRGSPGGFLARRHELARAALEAAGRAPDAPVILNRFAPGDPVTVARSPWPTSRVKGRPGTVVGVTVASGKPIPGDQSRATPWADVRLLPSRDDREGATARFPESQLEPR